MCRNLQQTGEVTTGHENCCITLKGMRDHTSVPVCMCVRGGTSTICVMTHLPGPLSPTESIKWLWWRNCNVITVPTLHSPSRSFTRFSASDSALYLAAQALVLCVFVRGVALPSLCWRWRSNWQDSCERERKTLIRWKDDKTKESRRWQEVMWVYTNCALCSLRSRPHNAKNYSAEGLSSNYQRRLPSHLLDRTSTKISSLRKGRGRNRKDGNKRASMRDPAEKKWVGFK